MSRLNVGIVLFSFLVGCGGSDNGGSVPTHPRARSLIGYGLVNYWTDVDPQSFAKTLSSQGLTFTEIAWAPWQGKPSDSCSPPSSAVEFHSKATDFIHAMEVEGITVLVEVANGNGCAQMKQPDQYVVDAVAWLSAHNPHALVTFAEPWASPVKSQRWTTIMSNGWSGLFVQPDRGANHYTGTKFYPSLPADYVDIHFCNAGEVSPAIAHGNPMVIVNTDCSPVLNPGPVVASQWAKEANASGANLMIYDFYAHVPDLATIQAMGAVL